MQSGGLAEISETNAKLATKLATTFIDSLGEQLNAEDIVNNFRSRDNGRTQEDGGDESIF